MIKKIILFLIISSGIILNDTPETVTIAILAKDKAHVLDEYLRCIEQQTWPKSKTYIYIKTNNNTDDTAITLKNWLLRVQDQYLGIYFDESNVAEQVEQYKPHEWNSIRFKVLGKIRQDSVTWAAGKKSHYFVADCDNFIKPHVIEKLIQTKLPIIAPFLTDGVSYYSNYHADIDSNGYFASTPLYYIIFNQELKGLIELPVVHCTYLIRYEVLDTICYDDESYRYEYVIFSDSARKNKIPQYLDNREMYGRITMADDREQFINELWFSELAEY